MLSKRMLVYPVLCAALCWSCMSCGPERSSMTDIQVLRMPYLQTALADSMTVLWRTDAGTESGVRFRKKGALAWSEAEGVVRATNTSLIENEVTLVKLEPGARYEYEIFTDEGQLLPETSLGFRAPVAAGYSVFSFFAVGDIGEAVEGGGTPDKLGEALSSYVDSLNFGLLLGDIVYPEGKSEDYDNNLFRYFREVFPYVPVFTILGNHDWHEPEANYIKEWKLPGNEHYYSFDYGNAHFIALDSKNGDFYDYERQVAWLEEDLSRVAGTENWKIVFLHHNGRSCTYKDAYENVVSLYPIFEKHGVHLVLNGHAHTYERLNPMNGQGEVVREGEQKGFTSITVGSGGKLRGVGTDPKAFTPDPDNCRYPGLVAAYAHDWAFLKLDISGESLRGTAITTHDLKVVDRFEIRK